jgi:hypothetical protein
MSYFRKSGFSQVVLLAVMALLMGVAYYWITRPAGSSVFLTLLPEFPLNQYSSFFARWFGWLPTLLHVFAFSLLTYLALGRRHLLFSCILWGVINALFELGQAMSPEYTGFIPDLFNIRSYFDYGVFDPLDLTACIAGAWAAWFIVRKRIVDIDKDRIGTERKYRSLISHQFRPGGKHS